jgi:hypothetical protein
MTGVVSRCAYGPDPHALEVVMGFEMREAHLNALSFVSRSGKRLCLHLPSCDIAGVAVKVAVDLARTAPQLRSVSRRSKDSRPVKRPGQARPYIIDAPRIIG